VGELEGGFGFLTQQVRAVHLDVLNFQDQTNQRFDKIDGRFDKVEGRLDRVEGRLDRVEAEVRQLREELPTVLGDVMREVLREQKS
jgi:tetrahydromethanopterin S-methyltransferase subunit G